MRLLVGGVRREVRPLGGGKCCGPLAIACVLAGKKVYQCTVDRTWGYGGLFKRLRSK